MSGASDLINYPLTVILTDPSLKTVANGGLVNNINGYDIGFYPDCSGTGAALKWELDSYTPTTGAIVAHVLRPTLSRTTDDTIGMYYGGSFSSFQSTPSAVWTASYAGVWHLSSTAGSDSSANALSTANNGAANGTGKLGGGVVMNGSGQNIAITDGAAVHLTGPFTISAWVNRAASNVNHDIFNSENDVSAKFGGIGLRITSANKLSVSSGKNTGEGLGVDYQLGNGSTNVSASAWHHVVGLWDGSNLKVYLDGVPDGSMPWTYAPAYLSTNYVDIGRLRQSGASYYWFNGTVDEVSVSSTNRSADWILTEYRNQSAPATYLSEGPQVTPTPFPNGYGYCKVVTTQRAMVSGVSDLTNYPLTVILTDTDLKTVSNDGLVSNSNGYDIGFYPDCSGVGAALKWEMESYSPTTGAIVAHVLRPTLSPATDDTIGMFYGGSFTSFQSTPSAVWDAGYKAVYHLPDGSSLNLNDSTASANNLANINAVAAAAGKVDGGASFTSGASSRLIRSSPDFPTGTQPRTLEGWFKMGANQTQELMGWGDNAGGTSRFAVYWDDDGKLYADCAGHSAAFPWTYNGNWHHIAFTFPAGATTTSGILGYFDGVPQTMTGDGATLATSAAEFRLGGTPASSAGDFYTGLLDEVRISNAARTADWIITEYRNQSAPGTYISAGPRLTSAPGGGGCGTG